MTDIIGSLKCKLRWHDWHIYGESGELGPWIFRECIRCGTRQLLSSASLRAFWIDVKATKEGA